MNPLNLLWIIPAAAAVCAVVFVLCGCKIAGEYDDACKRDAATLMEG